ncbi:MAG: hypothetical protein GPJ51_06585 [Candidatus Heimdallarchaeota archaeon]|nr:hypothetical protein [Candidatus Heimdallarchaeota archaeon]
MAESELLKISGVGPKAAKTLEDCGYNTIEKLAKATSDELSQLPGIGKSTAEKIVESAKEFKPTAKVPTAKKPVTKVPTAKKPVTKVPTAKKPVTKVPTAKKPITESKDKVIPKPKVSKTTPKAVVKKTEPRPSVRPPVTKAPVKKPVAVKPSVSEATRKAIEQGTHAFTIKKKRTKKSKPKRLAKISTTFGVVTRILHDGAGKSKNRTVIMKLYETEIPLEKYLGRKVKINFPNSERHLIGTISRLHGKSSSLDKTVVVRFSRGVSPHIITARGTFL